jgi:hypothetical protein
MVVNFQINVVLILELFWSKIFSQNVGLQRNVFYVTHFLDNQHISFGTHSSF